MRFPEGGTQPWAESPKVSGPRDSTRGAVEQDLMQGGHVMGPLESVRAGKADFAGLGSSSQRVERLRQRNY